MLSIIVVFHNMRREARRTLHSLSPAYQQGASAKDYEIIAVDSGSSMPLGGDWAESTGPNVRYAFHATDSVSPVSAVNHGASMARGDNLAVIVDGARMASPGLVAASLRALRLETDPVVCGLAWHLGPDVQNKSMLEGYCQQREDELLDSIAWPKDGYRLFEISVLAQSSSMGFLGGMPSELSWICLRKHTFDALGGFDKRFQARGGGLVNQDFRNRLMSRSGITPIIVLGEGVFHQYHGGVATNVPMERHPMEEFKAEYESVVGKAFKPSPVPPVVYFGAMPQAARKFINRSY